MTKSQATTKAKALEMLEGGDTAKERKNVQNVFPPSPECILADSEIQDKQALRKVESNNPLELVLLDPTSPEATVRVDSGVTLEMRGVM